VLHSLIATALILGNGQKPQSDIEAMIRSYCLANKVPSIAYAIGIAGKVQMTGAVQGIGPDPVASNTIYRLGSISKPVTAVATLQLVEQGKLSLDEDIRKAVPEWPDKGKKITLRQLLGHLGGIRHYGNKADAFYNHFNDSGSALKVFKDDPLVDEPGTKYSYSTHAFTIVARACENGSGLGFPLLIKSRISDVSNSPTLRCEDRRVADRDRATLYVKSGTDIRKVPAAEDLSWKYGGGGLESTAGDLCRFAFAVLEGRLLKPKTVDEMWTSQKTNDGKATGYGMGWSVGEGKYGRRASHSGAQQGAQSNMVVYRDKGVVIVLLSNLTGHPLGELTDQIADFVFAK